MIEVLITFKWLILLVYFLFLSLIRRVLFSELETIGGIRNSYAYTALYSLGFSFLTTMFFSKENDNFIIQLQWFVIDNFPIDFKLLFVVFFIVLLVYLLGGFFHKKSSSFSLILSLFVSDLASFLLYCFVLLVSPALLYVSVKLLIFLLNGNPGWWPTWTY